MNIAKVVPLYVLKKGELVNLVCKVHVHRPKRRVQEFVRYFPDSFTYDDIEEDLYNILDVSEVQIQRAWFLPVYFDETGTTE